jgi:hypothetical protein
MVVDSSVGHGAAEAASLRPAARSTASTAEHVT